MISFSKLSRLAENSATSWRTSSRGASYSFKSSPSLKDALLILNFPVFSEVKDGNSIKGKGVWSAVYVGTLESVEISGEITF